MSEHEVKNNMKGRKESLKSTCSGKIVDSERKKEKKKRLSTQKFK